MLIKSLTPLSASRIPNTLHLDILVCRGVGCLLTIVDGSTFLRRDRLRGVPPKFGLYNPNSRIRSGTALPEETKSVIHNSSSGTLLCLREILDQINGFNKYERVATFNH